MSDLIDRQALKQAMYHEAFEADTEMQKWDGGCWIRYKLFEKTVDIIPSVTPVQKTGYWIGEELGKCSNCGHSGCASDIWNGCEQMFCPNCGAKMESEE